MKYAYFPGCSLSGGGKGYEESFLRICGAVGIDLEELEDWNCCGATVYMSVNEPKAFALSVRNMSMAEKKGQDIVAPCSACYLGLNKAKHYIEDYPEIRDRVKTVTDRIGMAYKGTTEIRHPLDILVSEIGLEELAKKVKYPLKGWKVAPYYGCQIVRPYATFDNQRNPLAMDDLIKTLGGEVVPYPLKTRCCGGSLTGTIKEAGLRLCYNLLREAKRRGANAIATLCPLCQFNLEAYQKEVCKKYDEDVAVPLVYFTQLLGLALGIPAKELGIHRNLTSVDDLLNGKEVRQ